MVQFFKRVIHHFFASNTFQKGAALAYYAVFSLFPMIIIMILIFGFFFGQEEVSGELFNQIKSILGKDAELQIQNILKNKHIHHNSLFATLIGIATLIFSASGMLSQIHNAFNNIWSIKAKPKNSLLRYLTKHIASFSILIILFFMLFLSASIHSFLIKHSEQLYSDFKTIHLYEHLVSFLLIGFMFAVMFKFLGDAIVNWKPALLSGLFTSLLFLLGKIGVGMYIDRSHVSSTFGSTSLLALIMLWVYYISQIIFLGASFLMIISEKMKCKIQPSSNAVKIISQEIKV